jgi:FkbM family methyltransferase
MQVQDGRSLADAYDSLSRLPPGLLLDVGAAVGGTTRKMRKRSPESRVMAFEPNPANWPHFERQHDGDERVRLIKAAVSDEPGTVRFAARHAIEASNERWAEFAGASSIGRVQEDGEVEVPAVTLDDMLGEQTALFCKIDVQGFEAHVLRGAQQAIRDRRIKVLLVEFMLYPEIFPLLDGYACFSQEWNVIPRINPRMPPDFAAWDLGPGKPLSTGKIAHRSWPKSHPTDPAEFVAFQEAQNAKVGRCWTDLLFVSPDFVATYMEAALAPKAA